MEIVEDNKDMGINDKRYKDVMDLLMNIHNGKETRIQTGGDYIPYDTDNTFSPVYGQRDSAHYRPFTSVSSHNTEDILEQFDPTGDRVARLQEIFMRISSDQTDDVD